MDLLSGQAYPFQKNRNKVIQGGGFFFCVEKNETEGRYTVLCGWVLEGVRERWELGLFFGGWWSVVVTAIVWVGGVMNIDTPIDVAKSQMCGRCERAAVRHTAAKRVPTDGSWTSESTSSRVLEFRQRTAEGPRDLPHQSCHEHDRSDAGTSAFV